MAALLVGLKTSLYVMNRLKAYIDYLWDLPITQARGNFEMALVELHALVLQFLAQAIQSYQNSSLTRAFDAFWKPEEVYRFEDECDKIARRVEIEASNCDREEANQRKENLQRVLKELEELRDIKESVSLLEGKIDLAKLPTAEAAAFDSYVDELDARCHPDTRRDLLHQIREWASDPQGKCIFWLNGMAGTGKSTISRTVAQSFADDCQLGASFFFKRGEGERGNASRFFTTITTQLLDKLPALIPYVSNVINAERSISGKSLEEQFKKLIFQPLSQIKKTSKQASTLVIVVDALDECEREGDVKTILRLLSQTQNLESIRMRIFLTSRPEFPIRLGFKKMASDAHQDMILQDIPQAVIERDISAYLKDELERIGDEYNSSSPDSLLPQDWPGDGTIQALTAVAVPLFIFAATVCRFVADPTWGWDPSGRLATVLKYQTTSQASKLDQTYLPVIQHLAVGRTDSDKEILSREFREIVGSIVVLANPLSTSSLARLLGISKEVIDSRLHSLHSVLSIPSNRNIPVRLLHLSFREFLLDPEKQGKSEFWFWVDGKKAHDMLAASCLKLMSSLSENICRLESPGTLRREIDSQTIDDCLPADVRYACRYWIHHLEQSGKRIRDQDTVHIFFQEHFLHWLEALSLIRAISESITLVSTLQSLTAVSELT